MEKRQFENPEWAIYERMCEDVPRKVIDAIAGELELRFGAERVATDGTKRHSYERRFKVTRRKDGVVSEIDMTVRFTNMLDAGEECGWKGFYVEYGGSCGDGADTYKRDTDREYVGFWQDGAHPFADLMKVLEDYAPTEWIYNRIEMELRALREGYDELHVTYSSQESA